MRHLVLGAAGLLTALLITSGPVAAQNGSVLTRDSFPIGDGNGILCQVQDRSVGNPAKRTIFDRRWAVICRDNPRPIAQLYAFRDFDAASREKVDALRRLTIDCGSDAGSAGGTVAGATRVECRVDETDLGWSMITAKSGEMTFYAEGFSAYDDATMLALKSLLANRIVEGTIDAASTSVADPVSFARVQAETLKPEQALAEGYRRNLGGEYAEAAAYFETLQTRLAGESDPDINPGEYLVNSALQRSNLGEFGIASRLFARARPLTAGDPIASRLQRNFEAIDLLNQGRTQAAIERLEQPLDGSALGLEASAVRLAITLPISARLNQSQGRASLLSVVDELRLTPQERARIIDAQALQIRGTSRRLAGDLDGARADLVNAYTQAVEVRDGRVTSITRLRSQVLSDLALIAERQGDMGSAESYLRGSLALVQAQYPERRAVSALEARLASFLMRRDREAEALELYRKVIDRAVGNRNAVVGFANQLKPYFEHLAQRVEGDAEAANDFFRAMQVLTRPGVAETQAILARELSANSDEAGRLFRQSVDLGRDVERLRIRFEALGRATQTSAVQQEASELSIQIANLEQAQLVTQAKLSAYPQYRVVSPESLQLSDFRSALQGGEGYVRLAVLGEDVFLFYADGNRAKAYKLDAASSDIEDRVDVIRASISTIEGGNYVTYPFKIAEARALYRTLFDGLGNELAGVDHLIFEPDGAMLRLPVDILVSDDKSVALYEERSDDPNGDAFDFTGVEWLARSRRVSTAVSAQSFVDARRVKRSDALREYLGMGKNVPVDGSGNAGPEAAITAGGANCDWTSNLWNNPIDDAELHTVARVIGQSQSQLLTAESFTDTALKQKDDLDEFRILHFATHGIVTPPKPDCPANPALVTSFGGAQSDGLLSFEEIFRLDIDADLVILSACDTAGAASIEATRAAGVSAGGGTALDGLVRAFIGAGGRAVIASHWPVPDDFDATERLIAGFFQRGRAQTIGSALRQSQQVLMDEPDTSHPYYWAAFAIIGDGARELLEEPTAQASMDERANLAS